MPPLKSQALNLSLGTNYPAPVIDHSIQREKALALYKSATNVKFMNNEIVDNPTLLS
jgi:deoxyribodipyrimidine photo-lyase